MKVCVSIFLVFTVAFWSCDGSDENNTSDKRDTIPPLMTLRGNPLDTSYLYSRYDDPKVNVLDFIQGRLRCPDDGVLIKTHGFVDNERLGVYTLTYTAEDAAGNQAPPLTRTVVVRPNPDGFLTGNYNVVCTCTASLKGSATPTVTARSYSATIVPGTTPKSFDIISMDIGSERAVQRLTRDGDSLYTGYFHPDYQHSTTKGILDRSKNSFTIETAFYRYTPRLIYKCRNTFSKQLVLKERTSENL